LLKTYAIWEGQENRVFFYNSPGQRFAETGLNKTPDVQILSPIKAGIHSERVIMR